MVVAQIPLWILHSSRPAGEPSSFPDGQSNTLPSTSATNSSSNTADNAPIPSKKGDLESHIKLWDLGGGGADKRCAIYSCDVSCGRIATGGGDGKVRVWSLNALFVSKKVAPVSDEEGEEEIQAGVKRKRKMACFRPGGYESSDSSGSSASENSKKQTNSTTNTPTKNREDVPAPMDISSLVRKKTTVGGSAETTSMPNGTAASRGTVVETNEAGKKRKRASLFSTTPLPPRNPTLNAKHDQNGNHSSKPRALCTLSSHSGSVLTLRFSTSGNYLASAGDDSHVLLYTQTSTPALTGNLLSNDEENVENWTRIRILRGHALDVVGLAWAPDDSHLVSCSLDSESPICVWRLNVENQDGREVNSILHPYKVLGKQEHSSTVKGVAFDPAGKYIASSGDDPAIIIWRAFDDWGLEAKIDSSNGIFRTTSKQNSGGGSRGEEDEQVDVQALANLSLFRRISFAPDGTHICGTNATLRGKNIAAMIGREGWGVSTSRSGGGSGGAKNMNAQGAANLVGHSQPVVSSRHCPFFFDAKKKKSTLNEKGIAPIENGEDDDEAAEPKYSTIVALGDKKGFVTIWSTRKTRPIFKLQCSESRCTVTDIAWGLTPSSGQSSQSLVMVISLLDGYIVALKFDVEEELGTILSDEKRHRIFRHKYGIDLGVLNEGGAKSRRLVDDKSGPKLIENALQYVMENENGVGGDVSDRSPHSEDESVQSCDDGDDDNDNRSMSQVGEEGSQVESRSQLSGKKRIQPILLTTENLGTRKKFNGTDLNKRNVVASNANKKEKNSKKKERDCIADVLNSAEKAASIAKNVIGSRAMGGTEKTQSLETKKGVGQLQSHSKKDSEILRRQTIRMGSFNGVEVIAPSIHQNIYSLNLTHQRVSVLDDLNDGLMATSSERKIVATCTNSIKSPAGYGGAIMICTLGISCGNKVTWRDQILGSHCTALSGSTTVLAVGTLDGSIYLYGTPAYSGWKSGIGFRSHPPFVMTGPIVRLSLREVKSSVNGDLPLVELLVVMSDGEFRIYEIMPHLKLQYKGSVLAPMRQMQASSRSSPSQTADIPLPTLSRIQITESGHLLLVLSCKSKSIGGNLQGFIFSRDMEAWMRVSDSRFMFSHFYSSIPKGKLSHSLLYRLDETVRGCNETSQRSTASGFYANAEDDDAGTGSISTRAHCEDRMACAMILKSKADFQHWLRLYIRGLSMENDGTQLRFVVDMLLHNIDSDHKKEGQLTSFWWISSTRQILGIDRIKIVQTIIIPEMSKNRAMQRLTNEIATEMKTLL